MRINGKEIDLINMKAVFLQQVLLLLKPGSDELADRGMMDHDPEFEPYCSISRQRIAELMDQAFHIADVRKWFMLNEFFQDTLDIDELKLSNLTCDLFTKACTKNTPISFELAEAMVHSSYEQASLACDLAKSSGEG